MNIQGFSAKYGGIGAGGHGGEMEITSVGGNVVVDMGAKSWGGRMCRWIKDKVSFPIRGRVGTVSSQPLTRVKVDLLKDRTIDEKTKGLILKKIHRLEKQNIPFRVKHLRAMHGLIKPNSLPALDRTGVRP